MLERRAKILLSYGTRVLAVGLISLLLPPACADGDDDPTEPLVKVHDFIVPEQPLDKPAPQRQFFPADGERLWNAAKFRALNESIDRPGGIFDFSKLIPENFRSAENFAIEDYVSGETADTLRAVIKAKSALREGKVLKMTEMRLVLMMPEKDPNAPAKVRPQKPGEGKNAGNKPAVAKKKAAGGMSIPGGARVVIRAPKCDINLDTNEGHAYGGADIKIYPKPEEGKELPPMIIMTSEFMRWRSWNEAGTGSTEIVMYTCGNDPREADPEVRVKLAMPLADGGVFSMDTVGHGMIFESGTFDRPTPVYDDEGRTAGASDVARNRTIFHTQIRTEVTASVFNALMPFQGPQERPAKEPGKKPDAPAAKDGPKDGPKRDKRGDKKKAQAEPEPYKTVVTCNGPAIFDMAYVPRQKYNALADPNTGSSGESVELELKEIELGKRFDFLNRVNMVKTPIGEKAAAPTAEDTGTHMSCGDLRVQYPPGIMPSTANPPDYAEAIGQVKMFGYQQPPPPEPGKPAEAPQPFSIECKRMYLDKPEDNMYLVGPEGKLDAGIPLAYVKTAGVAAFAQQFCFRQKTRTMAMPTDGKKKMIIQAGAMGGGAPAAAAKPGEKPGTPAAGQSIFSGSGDTIMTWSGPLIRETRHVPVKHSEDILTEVLTLNKDVVIERPDSGLKLYGELVKLYRDIKLNEVQHVFATEKVDVFMKDAQGGGEPVTVQASGDTVMVDMAYEDQATDQKDAAGEPIKTRVMSKNTVTILGNRKAGIKADVFRGGGNAIRTDKFVMDMMTNNFTAFGGAVAVVKSETPEKPPEPKPEAAQGAGGLVSGFDFETGGNISIQCDGTLFQNGKEHFLAADGNVLIRQTGRTLKANYVKIMMEDTPPAPPAGKTGPAKPDPVKDGSKPPAQQASGDFFSGALKSMECFEMVELMQGDSQFIQCDKMVFDAKEQQTLLEMDDAEDDVRVYLHDDDGTSKVLLSRSTLKMDQKTGIFTPGGKQLLMLPYKEAGPAPRKAENSPARKKAK